VVTPDLKLGDRGVLVHVDLGAGRRRLGGSALAQAYSQLGDDCPDVSSATLRGMWEATQGLLASGQLSAGHDVSDGGVVTTLLEMACEFLFRGGERRLGGWGRGGGWTFRGGS
jgi:phosphoribosylformylglycinamidine synthase